MLETRLLNQKLVATTLKKPEQVVSWLGAVQAQDFYGAKWALGLRAVGLTDAVVDSAFDAGTILRTHVLRPTWHFVTPADIRWMLALTGPRVQVLNRGYARTLGITARDFTRGRAVVERALEGRRYLTRAELSEVLRRAGVIARGQRLAHLMMDFELVGAICSGPRRSKQFTYALLAERAPNGSQIPRDEALARLTDCFFRSRGPATAKDFAWWSGLTMSDVKTGIEMTRMKVLSEPLSAGTARGETYLLPNYDEYLIAYKDRSAIIDAARVRNLGVFTNNEHPHHLVVDGRVAGSWKRALRSMEVDVDIAPYRRLRGAEATAVRKAVAQYARFMGKATNTSYSEIHER